MKCKGLEKEKRKLRKIIKELKLEEQTLRNDKAVE